MKLLTALVLTLLLPFVCWGETRFENFDTDPQWDAYNNFSTNVDKRPVVQNFGYSATTHCDGVAGELGGTITPDGVPAYYAKRLSALTFDDTFSVSGTMYVAEGEGHTLVGFFNTDTAKEWRMADSIVLRIYGRGGEFQVYDEYGTSLWRVAAGAMVDGDNVANFASDTVYSWSLTYTPIGSDSGQIEAEFGGHTSEITLEPGHRADGGLFTHFGMINVVKHADGGGQLWIDNLVINGVPEDLTQDPGWEESGNHASYASEDTRPRFAFGYSATNYAGGGVAGEIGGKTYRGDCRNAIMMAYYGDSIADLTLDSPIEASGKVCLRRACSDSTTLIGFFHSQDSIEVNDSQDQAGLARDFLGFAIEGPSTEGFFVYPCYRTNSYYGSRGQCVGDLSYIYPNSEVREWSFSYDPEANSGQGEILLTCSGLTATLPLQPDHKASGARFNRFGIVTTWVDGNGQTVYFDDLRYTADVPTTAAFSATPRAGEAPLEVTFTDESASKYALTGWTWDFGDGSPVSHDRNPVHTYTENGAYSVRLTVETAEDSDSRLHNWCIDVGNTLPAAGAAGLFGLILLLTVCAVGYVRRYRSTR